MDAPRSGLVSHRFELGELLGSGGSASVFVALDTMTGARVALKVLHPHLSQSARSRAAFFVEAQAVVGLVHPNIVAVLDFGVHEGAGEPLAWIALELAPGLTLAEHVDRFGPLHWRDALAVADGVLRALEAAHAAGVVHRDVSPANVMVGMPGAATISAAEVRLVDFGLADAAGRPTLAADILRTTPAAPPSPSPDGAAGADADGAADDGRAGVATAPLGVLGSANYMSPEQALGLPVDERGDVYQVGALLHFALTGRPPFVRPSVTGVMRAHVSAPPAVPSVLGPGIPRGVDRLVVKALLKDPSKRHPSAAVMRAEVVALAVRRGAATAAPSLTVVSRPAPGSALEPRLAPGLPRDAAGRSVGASAAQGSAPFGQRGTGATGTPRTAAAAAGGFGQAPQTPPPAATARTSLRGIVVAGGVLVATVVAVAWTLSLGAAPSPTSAAQQPAATSSIDPAVALSAAPTEPTEPAEPATSTAPAPMPTPTELAPSTPPSVSATVPVPGVLGADLAAAQRLLETAGLAPGAVSSRDSPSPRGSVLSSSPDAATLLAPGATVDLVVASGSNVVPVVAGLPQGDAITRLQSAGFAVAMLTRAASGAQPGSVSSSEPVASVVLALGSVVTITVASAPPPSPQPPTPTPSAPALP